MKYLAHAKINLGLKLIGKEGTYHTLDMLNALLELADEISIVKSDTNEVIFNDDTIPTDNTVTKALHLMQTTYDIKQNFKIKVTKNIPLQAGLGGGSSDAATVMKAINKMMKLNIDSDELAKLSLAIGSDVPYFFSTSFSRVQGKGEIVTPLSINPPLYHVLLVKPFLGVSTSECYKRAVIDDKTSHIPQLIEALEQNKLSGELLVNDLYSPAISILPSIKNIVKRLKYSGLDLVMMSGSGSTVFALSNDLEKLQAVQNKLMEKYPTVIITKII